MATVKLSQALRDEYENLFNTCVIRHNRAGVVEGIIAKIQANTARYNNAESILGVPWFFTAVIHNMESSLNFTKHLHNGDPLVRRTVQAPAGRPKNGDPPFTWEESASDALSLKGLSSKTDWSLSGTLYQLERYNGFGYRLYHPHVLSPYLWSYSNHYTSGKFVADGIWSDTAVSKQCGAAVLLRRMAENIQIDFADQPIPKPDAKPLVVRYSLKKSSDPMSVSRAGNSSDGLIPFQGCS